MKDVVLMVIRAIVLPIVVLVLYLHAVVCYLKGAPK